MINSFENEGYQTVISYVVLQKRKSSTDKINYDIALAVILMTCLHQIY